MTRAQPLSSCVVLVVLAGCGGGTPAKTGSPTTGSTTTAPTGWPGVAWDSAEVVVFNQVEYGPGLTLTAWDPDHGWNPTVVSRQPVERELGAEAATLVEATGGGVEVSKCALPRNAIVLFAGTEPVASANVCFACGDIVVSPDPRPARDWGAATDAELEAWQREDEARLATYDATFPRWQALFRDQLGLAIEWPPS
ncbi:MAG: hypothetical protein R2939_09590 [Kofleriaceae bacterium]